MSKWLYSRDNPDSPYDWTQQRIADEMGLTQERVNQIINAYKINNSSEKDSGNNNLKKTKAEIEEEKLIKSEEELKKEQARFKAMNSYFI